ncbi:carboxymuconolactone decarboxylase family protein [Enterovibrio paralichthyis]|uniref:carboxymuconolactone decarboxylase family protein n=1 Tax=Enterovibrio paralichthyis TaxID=2853805 RepID=UPI001C48BCF7|nr:carboxymuconolactone decarboxylase family protein [Enterovibrio paralichthyis]MBV7299032.1 carboxymuconolactone decarboxylase family protein [Enterovibrio paralichthyis]
MSRIEKLVNPQGAAEITLSAINKNLGMVPNLYATIAHSPTVLNAILALGDELGKGKLTARQRELVALAVGQTNACQYCLSAHTLIASSTGLSKDEILAARKITADNPLDQAIVEFAALAVKQRGVISDEQLQQLQTKGLTDELLFEVLAQVALNTFTNYANHIAGTDVDFPAVSLTV